MQEPGLALGPLHQVADVLLADSMLLCNHTNGGMLHHNLIDYVDFLRDLQFTHTATSSSLVYRSAINVFLWLYLIRISATTAASILDLL